MLMRFWRMRHDGPMPLDTGHHQVQTRQVRPHRKQPAHGRVLSCASTLRPNWIHGQQNEHRPVAEEATEQASQPKRRSDHRSEIKAKAVVV
jgi:hypothetical protein